MNNGWVWGRPAARVACRLLDRMPATIADRLSFTVDPTGRVSFQVDHLLPLGERLAHVEQIAELLKVETEWMEYINRPGQWAYQARHAVVDGIEVEVWAHARADELLPSSREPAGVGG